jgi:Leucine-rich repeat (LRR) protein
MKYAMENTRSFDSKFAKSMIGREAPNDCLVRSQDIVAIGNLFDVPQIRKLDLSFNPVEQLYGLDQLAQLRWLAAFSCKVVDTSFVGGIPRLETLFLHQNKITDIDEAFAKLNKLRELRLDKNRISKLINLQGLQALRSLDVSFNAVSSLEGLSGLQFLRELNVSNNRIKSFKPLRALPNLVELRAQGNHLKSLEGIQQLPRLEVLHCEHNMLSSVQVAHTYQQETGKSVKSRGAKDEVKTAKQPGGMAALTEIYLSGNRLSGLDGLETLGTRLEVVDVSHNNIRAASAVTPPLSACPRLMELFLAGNPVLGNAETGADAGRDEALLQVARTLAASCEMLRSVDHLVCLAGEVHLPTEAAVALAEKTRELSAPAAGQQRQKEGQVSEEFHTWEDGDASTVMTGGAETIQEDEEENGYDSQEEVRLKAARAFNAGRGHTYPDLNAHQDEGRFVPRLNADHVMTEEEIGEMEHEFEDGVAELKTQIFRAVFEAEHPDDPDPSPHEVPVYLKPRPLKQEDTPIYDDEEEEEDVGAKRPALYAQPSSRYPRLSASQSEASNEMSVKMGRIRQILKSKGPKRQMLAELSDNAAVAAIVPARPSSAKSLASTVPSHKNRRSPVITSSPTREDKQVQARRQALDQEMARIEAELGGLSQAQAQAQAQADDTVDRDDGGLGSLSNANSYYSTSNSHSHSNENSSQLPLPRGSPIIANPITGKSSRQAAVSDAESPASRFRRERQRALLMDDGARAAATAELAADVGSGLSRFGSKTRQVAHSHHQAPTKRVDSDAALFLTGGPLAVDLDIETEPAFQTVPLDTKLTGKHAKKHLINWNAAPREASVADAVGGSPSASVGESNLSMDPRSEAQEVEAEAQAQAQDDEESAIFFLDPVRRALSTGTFRGTQSGGRLDGRFAVDGVPLSLSQPGSRATTPRGHLRYEPSSGAADTNGDFGRWESTQASKENVAQQVQLQPQGQAQRQGPEHVAHTKASLRLNLVGPVGGTDGMDGLGFDPDDEATEEVSSARVNTGRSRGSSWLGQPSPRYVPSRSAAEEATIRLMKAQQHGSGGSSPTRIGNASSGPGDSPTRTPRVFSGFSIPTRAMQNLSNKSDLGPTLQDSLTELSLRT